MCCWKLLVLTWCLLGVVVVAGGVLGVIVGAAVAGDLEFSHKVFTLAYTVTHQSVNISLVYICLRKTTANVNNALENNDEYNSSILRNLFSDLHMMNSRFTGLRKMEVSWLLFTQYISKK